ncbi:CDP-glycerol glycerophosphotransferase family protein [Mycoplasma sp. P36-A1]|uniref:CDP-glycerol glycerophosphotransferase family protein n=1 Tax=Mycoplasma sp. P36-A1 TaxID=3252900 RepID=UPI003C2F3E48
MKRLLIRTIVFLKNNYYKIKCFIAYLLTKTDSNTILFESYAGKYYNDNPYAIFKELTKSNKYNLVFALKNNDDIENFQRLYPNCLVVKSHSFKHFKMLKQAKLWVFNYKSPSYFKKAKQTYFLQTWHGIPLKKLGCDIEKTNNYFYRSLQTYQQMIDSYIDEGAKCDYFISPSDYATKHLVSAFKLNENKIIKTMYPRNLDILNFDVEDIINFKKMHNIAEAKKIILYAPTYRDNNKSLIAGYSNNGLIDLDKFSKLLNKEFVVLYKPHYLIKNNVDLSKYSNIIDVSNYQDIAQLYPIADILITDYSSVYFDYALLKRPIYFYMPDLSNYKDELRGFYININNDLPNDYHISLSKLCYDINNSQLNYIKYNKFYEKNKYYQYDLDIDKLLKGELH